MNNKEHLPDFYFYRSWQRKDVRGEMIIHKGGITGRSVGRRIAEKWTGDASKVGKCAQDVYGKLVIFLENTVQMRTDTTQ